MSNFNENDILSSRCEAGVEDSSRGMRGTLGTQIADILTHPQEHKAHLSTASALEAIAQANKILPYIDMTQAFMANPDPNYQRRQTFKPPQSADGCEEDSRRRRPAPGSRR